MPAWLSDLPLGSGVRIIAHDRNGLIAFSKPEGVLSHPNTAGDRARSMLTAPYVLDGEYYSVSAGGQGDRRLHLLNRLDSGTSGVILAATSEALARDVRDQFKRRRILKRYHALVFGSPAPLVQVWRDRLAVRKQGGQIRTEAAGNIPSEAKVQVISVHPGNPPLALLQLEPRTGRSHQLRVQCAQRHLPIVGDATYGDFALNREFTRRTGLKRLFLHSSETTFDYEWAGRTWRFSARADLPEAFEEAWRLGGRGRGK
ncbi:MAG: RNA pseudouridine synthase [Opitutaceae bacterium]|nr:RNA pseudouridine synthase [Opitutaceae bacterium]